MTDEMKIVTTSLTFVSNGQVWSPERMVALFNWVEARGYLEDFIDWEGDVMDHEDYDRIHGGDE